jgi:hypothetical protein
MPKEALAGCKSEIREKKGIKNLLTAKGTSAAYKSIQVFLCLYNEEH